MRRPPAYQPDHLSGLFSLLKGEAAEVRVTDSYGNTHYLRAEPLEDDAEIPQGADVLVIRQRTAPGEYRFRLMAVGDGA
jgi:hypothetical protein